MFFYIGEKSPIQSLTEYNPGLYLDKAWEMSNVSNGVAWFKGYSTDCILSETIDKIVAGYQPAGKWCVIYFDGKYSIFHPVLRGFPIYGDDSTYTNLKIDSLRYIQHYSPVLPMSDEVITLDIAASRVKDVLVENTINFYRYNSIDRLNVLYSGGLDTLTSWAVLDSVTTDYDLDVCVPKTPRGLGTERPVTSDLIDKVSTDYWGYGISSTYAETKWYLTGFYSERMQIREVTQLSAIANYYGKATKDLPVESDYLYWFMQRPSNPSTFFTDSERELKEYCFSTVSSDYQMWHLNNNFHFSPFFDIRISEIMSLLPMKDILSNGLNGIVQRKIIEKCRPDFLQILSDYKNSKDVFKNFRNNFKNIELAPEINVKIR